MNRIVAEVLDEDHSNSHLGDRVDHDEVGVRGSRLGVASSLEVGLAAPDILLGEKVLD